MRRHLTDPERTFVRQMLAIAGLSRSPYARQVPSLRVVGKCDCGCPTVDFATPAAGKPLVDAYARTKQGEVVGAILWEKEGQLSGLELYSMAADPKELPHSNTLSLDPAPHAG